MTEEAAAQVLAAAFASSATATQLGLPAAVPAAVPASGVWRRWRRPAAPRAQLSKRGGQAGRGGQDELEGLRARASLTATRNYWAHALMWEIMLEPCAGSKRWRPSRLLLALRRMLLF